MLGKVTAFMQEKSYIVPAILLQNYRKLKITDSELVVLLYFLNINECFNPKQISNCLGMDLKEIMSYISSLTEKSIIKIQTNSKKEEIVSLDSLYEKLAFIFINGQVKEEKQNLFDVFEKEFNRTLSPLDYEIISDWQKEFSDELILLALKEAVFNNVLNLRYVDRILRDWNKKGIKTEKDVTEDKINFQKRKIEKSDKKLFDYDWLNERDN